MTYSALDSGIYARIFGDEEVSAQFSDERFIATMLAVEVALARVEGRLGVIPASAADAIALAVHTFAVDMDSLQTGVERSGVPTIDLVQQLRRHIGKEYGEYVHWGATTQDIMDTALVLQMRGALDLLAQKLERVIASLAALADRHRSTIMAGRTHAQQALPVTFGLKAAGWLAPLLRHRQRLRELKPRLLVVQFGGAAGTLASLGEAGLAVQEELAAELALGLPPMPWHTQRDVLAEVAGWLAMVSGSLAKMAQDVILMAQSEIGEVRESADPARGGSSTMPQKANPVASEVIVAAARTNAALLSSMHQAQLQEHERGTHGWQIEWLNLPQMFGLTAAALNKSIFVGENLDIKAARMQQNVAASNGLILAEAVNFALAADMSRSAAKALIRQACETVRTGDRHLVDVMQELTDAPIDWNAVRDESNYLGSATQFVDKVLFAARQLD